MGQEDKSVQRRGIKPRYRLSCFESREIVQHDCVMYRILSESPCGLSGGAEPSAAYKDQLCVQTDFLWPVMMVTFILIR